MHEEHDDMNGAMLLPEFDQEMANTRRMLESVPDAKLAYKPHEKSYALRDLAAHIANLPMWTTVTLTTTGLDLSEPFDRVIPNSTAEILAQFDEHAAAARTVLEKTSAEDMMVPWTLRSGDQVHFTMPRAATFRAFVMSHLIHHRAQLGVYLRLLDVPVPGMYGPSADEPGM
jgi:uncharacterized damage-inducible protein DinB